MQLCNSQAHKSNIETIQAEMKLMSYVRISDTFQMHDTITILEDLVAEPRKFYELAEQIVGQNYLKAPHEVLWLGEEGRQKFEFESSAPLWLDMHQPNSLASWILYYFERSLFIQYQINVHSQFLDCRDAQNQSIIIGTDSKNIVIKDELKPFWRSLCEGAATESEELLANIKNKAI